MGYHGGMEHAEYLSVAEAAATLGMSASGVRTRLERGQMAGTKVGARAWIIPRAEVERWRTLGRQKTGPKRRDGDRG